MHQPPENLGVGFGEWFFAQRQLASWRYHQCLFLHECPGSR